jgi:general secretion pathway protein K
MMSDRGRERGAALLTVLLLVAVIAVLAATALERLRVSTRLAGNAAALDQARGLAFAAETLATTRITALLSRSPDRVALVGGWYDRPYALPVPGGVATARITDGGNCFNLNSLVIRTGETDWTSYTPARVQFAQLIRLIGAPGDAEAIAAAAADWIDTDQSPLPGGAEDANYTGYRTAGTLMADPSELRAVAGVRPDVYAALRPWICTLPVARPVSINVNTLSPEQAPLVAMSMPEGAGLSAIRAAILRRPELGYDSVEAFLNQTSLGGETSRASGLAVTTQWFALRIDVRLGGAALEEHALVDASALPAQLVSRQWGDAS